MRHFRGLVPGLGYKARFTDGLAEMQVWVELLVYDIQDAVHRLYGTGCTKGVPRAGFGGSKRRHGAE